MKAIAALALLLSAGPALALDFRAVSTDAAVLYDAPSARSQKLFVVNRGYPLEVIVNVEGWVKVRDANGGLGWVESKVLSDRRTVMVKVPLAQVRQKPDDGAPIAFQAQQNVLLDFVEVSSGGWVHVRHRDGPAGYVRSSALWGI